MGHKHTRDEILVGAVEVAFRDGLSRLTYGRVAAHLGINDRTVVYYFPTKNELVDDVLTAMGAQLQETLAPALDAPAADHIELLRVAWPILSTAEADRVFAVFFEANGLAVVGREPFDSAVRGLVADWVDWVAALIDGDDDYRRGEAEATIAVLDGLLLLRLLAGPAAGQRAAARLGIA